MYRISKNKKLQRLLEQNKRVFRTGELAVLWGIDKQNTLLVTLSRYVKQKLLWRLSKGVYAVLPPEKLHPYEIGCGVAGPLSYVSGETILFREGVINQRPEKITLMGRYEKEFEIGGNRYWVRRVSLDWLVDRWGVKEKERWSEAGVKRAQADLRKVDKSYYFDKEVRDDGVA